MGVFYTAMLQKTQNFHTAESGVRGGSSAASFCISYSFFFFVQLWQRCGHDEGRVAGGAAQVEQAAYNRSKNMKSNLLASPVKSKQIF